MERKKGRIEPQGEPREADPGAVARIDRAAVVGAGSWGTAFACHLVECGVETVLMTRRADQAHTLRRKLRNPDYLDFLDLPPDLGYDDYSSAEFDSFDLVVLAIPSKAYRGVLAGLSGRLGEGVGVLSLTKGLDPTSHLRLSAVLAQELGHLLPRFAMLSGPNHAEEVALRQPSAAVVASLDWNWAKTLQQAVGNENLRVYVNSDLIGVELASAVKNVVALATGMSDGLGYGDNARAALITRGLAEMTRLGMAMGAEQTTFAGLAGLGDLVGTCTSRHSRNRMAGDLIAQGHDAESVEREMGMVAEGLTTAPTVLSLAEERGIELPITESVVAVLQHGKDVRLCVHDLMSRDLRDESG